MQVVIDIPDKDYQNLKAKDKFDDMYLNYYEKLIVNGIPLPQNHGDLIDSNGLKASMFCYMKDMNKSYTARYVMSVAKGLVDFQKPLIKADVEEE